jgi:hypothetical protein
MTTPPTHSAAETRSPSTAIAISATQNGSRWRVVEEGWWTDAPVRRAYAELVLADGGSCSRISPAAAGTVMRRLLVLAAVGHEDGSEADCSLSLDPPCAVRWRSRAWP